MVLEGIPCSPLHNFKIKHNKIKYCIPTVVTIYNKIILLD